VNCCSAASKSFRYEIVHGLDAAAVGPAYPVAMNYLGVLIVVAAAILLSWFALDFADWNKEQACATSGGRKCGVSHAYFSR
jgi:hypothetical protein